MSSMTSVEHALRSLLADQVQRGDLGPGAKLPTERELVLQLAAPRSAIRRALTTLEQEGLLTRHVGRGTFLNASANGRRISTPADTSPAEIMQVRLLLEPQVAPLAARAATQADLDRISHRLERGGRAHDYDTFESWDVALHRAIAEATHNALLLSLFDSMSAARNLPVWGNLKRRNFTAQLRRSYQDDHTAIVSALLERDGNAARDRMREHLTRVSDNLLGQH